MNALARLGFLLLGIGGLVDACHMTTELAGEANRWSAPVSETLFAGAAPLILLPAFVLPVLVLFFSRRLANLAFPPESRPLANLDGLAFISAGVCVLGVYFAVLGVSGLAGVLGMLLLASEHLDRPGVAQGIASGVFSSFALLVLGGLLYFFGPRVLSRA